MKTVLCSVMALVMLVGSTTKTEYGECIGAFDDGEPNLKYKVSVLNTVMAIIFSETIVVPFVVIVDQARCPVGRKQPPTTEREAP